MAWIRHKDLHILSVGQLKYTSDNRYDIVHRPSTNEYQLHISYIQAKDAGVYECQISTKPISAFHIDLRVVPNQGKTISRFWNCKNFWTDSCLKVSVLRKFCSHFGQVFFSGKKARKWRRCYASMRLEVIINACRPEMHKSRAAASWAYVSCVSFFKHVISLLLDLYVWARISSHRILTALLCCVLMVENDWNSMFKMNYHLTNHKQSLWFFSFLEKCHVNFFFKWMLKGQGQSSLNSIVYALCTTNVFVKSYLHWLLCYAK